MITPRIGPWSDCGSRSWPSGPTCRSTRSASTKSASCCRRPTGGPGRLVRTRASRAPRPHPRAPGRGSHPRADRAAAQRRPRRRPTRRSPSPSPSPKRPRSSCRSPSWPSAPAVPPALLEAVAREGLLVPRIHEGGERYTAADVDVVRAGLSLLEAGFPLTDLLALAREHNDATTRHRRAGRRVVRPLRARAAARVGPLRRREGRAARRRVPHAAARGHRARRASLPARAARGRAGAPGIGRRGRRARGGQHRGVAPARRRT